MLNHESVMRMRQLYTEEAWTQTKLAKHFQVSQMTVSNVLTGRTWSSVTGGQNVSRYRRTTQFHCDYIQERIQKGITNYQTIGDELGITRQAVRQLIKKKGLTGGHAC